MGRDRSGGVGRRALRRLADPAAGGAAARWRGQLQRRAAWRWLRSRERWGLAARVRQWHAADRWRRQAGLATATSSGPATAARLRREEAGGGGSDCALIPMKGKGTGREGFGGSDVQPKGILLYEMLYGRTPFRGKNRQRTFANILHKDLTFPSSIPVSLAARQLIHALLQRDPANRLGSITGVNEIKQHPFFREINWALIRCLSPPQLDVPLQLIKNEPDLKSKDAQWDNEEVLIQTLETF